ncbi:hypothetical protein GCM10028816_53650 [Spirosoma lituiforme]
MGVFLGLFGFTPYIVFNYNSKIFYYNSFASRVAKKMWIRLKRLRNMPGEGAKNKKQKGPRVC